MIDSTLIRPRSSEAGTRSAGDRGTCVVLGLGATGVSCARHLAAGGFSVLVLDSRAEPPGADRLRPIDGSPPRIVEVARHRCGFADRCAYQERACLDGQPALQPIGPSQVACVRAAHLELPGVGHRRS